MRVWLGGIVATGLPARLAIVTQPLLHRNHPPLASFSQGGKSVECA